MKLIFTLLFACCFFASHAQMKGLTENGDEIILYNDGTWKYVKAPAANSQVIDTNQTKFTRLPAYTFLVKSKVTKYGVYINPQKWMFEKEDANEPGEYKFYMKSKDCYGMIIAEKMQLPIETLKTLAYTNAKSAAPDVEITKQEYRNVNGVTVLCLQMSGTISGLKFVYLGYYYSSEGGTIQLLTYTFESMFKERKTDMENLLNGFVVVE